MPHSSGIMGNCIACIYVRATVVLDQLAASSPPLDPSFQTLITFRWWWVWVYNGTGKQRVRQGLERRDRRRRKGWNKERSRKRDFRQEIQARTLMSWDPVFLCMCNHARKYVCQKHVTSQRGSIILNNYTALVPSINLKRGSIYACIPQILQGPL